MNRNLTTWDMMKGFTTGSSSTGITDAPHGLRAMVIYTARVTIIILVTASVLGSAPALVDFMIHTMPTTILSTVRMIIIPIRIARTGGIIPTMDFSGGIIFRTIIIITITNRVPYAHHARAGYNARHSLALQPEARLAQGLRNRLPDRE